MSSFKLPQAPEFRFSAEREMRAAIQHLRLLPVDDVAEFAVAITRELHAGGCGEVEAVDVLGALAAAIETIHLALNPED